MLTLFPFVISHMRNDGKLELLTVLLYPNSPLFASDDPFSMADDPEIVLKSLRQFCKATPVLLL
jgi:hypothetical protein